MQEVLPNSDESDSLSTLIQQSTDRRRVIARQGTAARAASTEHAIQLDPDHPAAAALPRQAPRHRAASPRLQPRTEPPNPGADLFL